MKNYPNPFNPTTIIGVYLPTNEKAKLVVYNILGQKVITLHDGFLEAGAHEISWSGINQSGQQVSSGIYFYSLELTNKRLIKKMLLAK